MTRVLRLVAATVTLAMLGACQKIEMSYCAARLPAARLVVDSIPLSYQVKQQYDARSLGDAHGNDGESITYGLTTARSSVTADVSLHAMRLGGAVCVRPDLTVQLAYQPMSVEIARELVRGSCAYNTVLGHEEKHVDVYRSQLAAAVVSLRDELAHHGFEHVERFSDIDHATAAMQTMQDTWLVPHAHELLDLVAARQLLVDTPAEYQRVASSCPDNPLVTGHEAPAAPHF
jgi:hypothetical protein